MPRRASSDFVWCEFILHSPTLHGVSHIVLRSNISCDGTEHIVSVGHIELASAPFRTPHSEFRTCVSTIPNSAFRIPHLMRCATALKNCLPTDKQFFVYVRYYLSLFSHCWLAIPQLVLQADWQEVWHSPQPPFFALSQRFAVSRVLICSIFYSSVMFIYIKSIS